MEGIGTGLYTESDRKGQNRATKLLGGKKNTALVFQELKPKTEDMHLGESLKMTTARNNDIQLQERGEK